MQSADFSSYTFLYKAEPELTDYCAYNSVTFFKTSAINMEYLISIWNNVYINSV